MGNERPREDERFYVGRSPWVPSMACKLAAHLAEGEQVSFRQHHTIIEAGAPVTQLCYLVKGTVKAVVLNHDGTEKLLFILTAPNILAETAVLTGGPSLVQFVAQSDCEVCRFEKKFMQQLLDTDTELARQMLLCMAQKTKSLVHQLAGTAMTSAEERLLHLLYVLYQESGYQENGCAVIPRKLTHADLADATGLHRVTVSNLLSKYQKAEILYKEKDKIIIKQWDYVLDRVL